MKTEHSIESATLMSEISDQLMETNNDALKGHVTDKTKETKNEPSIDLVFLGKAKSDSDECNSRSFTSSSHLQNVSNENMSLERGGKPVCVKVEQCQYKGKEMGSLPSAESGNVVRENVDRNSSGMIKVNKEKTSLQPALSRRKIRVKTHKQLKDDTAGKSCGEDEKHAVDRKNDLANVYLNDKKLKPEIGTIASEATDNKSCGGNTVEQKINSSFMEKSDPMLSTCRNENAEPSTALTAPATVVINEEWVCCDKCEKWRLLPYGMNPDTLPKKWRCSMLSWLPGMSSCKISEDDTTRALRALYMVPALENNVLDGHHDNVAADIGIATATTSKCNIQSTSISGKLNSCHDGANMVNNVNLNDMSKPSKKLHAHSSRNSGEVDCFPKPREKRKHAESSRKGENVEKDRTPLTRSGVGVDHDDLRPSKKLKTQTNMPATYRCTQFVTRKNSPSVNEASKNMRKHIGNSPSMGNYGSSSSGKHYHGEDKYFSDEVVKTSGAGKSDVPDLSTKKKKSKERLLSQREPDHLPSNTTSNCNPKRSDVNVVMEKPWTELKFPKADRAVANSRGGVTEVDDIMKGAEKVCFERHQENINLPHSLPSESSTRRNICHTKTAAPTSSSSKVSKSHKDKVDIQGTRTSPIESVSSSPLRTSDNNPLDQHKRHSRSITENVHSQELGNKGLARSKRKYDFGSDSDQYKAHVSGCLSGGRDHHGVKDGDLFTDDQDLKNVGLNKKDSVSGAQNGHFKPVKEKKANSGSLSLHENQNQKQVKSHENGKTQPHFNSNQSDHSNLNNRPDKGNAQYKDLKINPSTVKGSKQQSALINAENGDATFMGKQSEKAVIGNLETRKQVTLGEGASNPLNASILMKEAKDLKHLSKRLKEKGEDFESTSMCFEAALKFLHVASLWEVPSTDSSKQVDPIHAMQLFSETGNLCGFCAHEFERLKKMANAALAYKCVEVAYMKAAFFKHPGAIKDRQALQIASLMVPPAESPSSSASDVDNLNNQSTAAKAVSVRGVYSPQIASNPISRNNHHMMGLLAYVEDINNAFEGTRKSQNSFSAYLSSIGKNQVDDVALVRKILDFSFHNVKGLLQLIRQSLESINHESVK